MLKRAYIPIVSVLLFGCSWFDYSPHEITLAPEERDIISKAVKHIQAHALEDDTIKFVMTGDTQGSYDDNKDLVDFVNKQYPSLDFVLICGDLTNYGLRDEFKWLHRRLKKLNVPYIPVIGNHDFIANGPEIFKQMYGPYDFSFKVGSAKFVAINTNSIEFAYDGTVPNVTWLQEELRDTADINNIYVFSHVMPWDDAFDRKLEVPFREALAAGKVKISFHGHHHIPEYHVDYYGDGVTYAITGSTNRRAFIVVTLWNDGNDNKVEKVFF